MWACVRRAGIWKGQAIHCSGMPLIGRPPRAMSGSEAQPSECALGPWSKVPLSIYYPPAVPHLTADSRQQTSLHNAGIAPRNTEHPCTPGSRARRTRPSVLADAGSRPCMAELARSVRGRQASSRPELKRSRIRRSPSFNLRRTRARCIGGMIGSGFYMSARASPCVGLSSGQSCGGVRGASSMCNVGCRVPSPYVLRTMRRPTPMASNSTSTLRK